MAFSGLPSKACANCRLRRIKCNLAEPECAQCRRAGKVCPGYRDQLALLFRDENEKVIRKARDRSATILAHKSERTTKAYSREKHDSAQTRTSFAVEKRSNMSSTAISILRNQPVTLFEDPGVNFFIHRYMTDSPSASVGQLDIFSSPLWRSISEYEPFLDAISCVGLSGLSNVKNDQQMMRTARLKYAVTLRRVMTSLQVPESADIGYTMKAVMMLALFEMINCDSPGTALWSVHFDGIAALLSSDRFKKIQEEFGACIKHQFYFVMFIKHVQRGQKFPATIAKWARMWGASLCEKDAPVASLAEIIIKFVDLHACVKQGEVESPSVVIEDALLLEAALEAWKTALPPIWKYKVVLSSQPQGTFDGQYHIYNDHWIAQIWDHYRWTRILVHELILSHVILLPSPLAPEMYKQQTSSHISPPVFVPAPLASSIDATQPFSSLG